MIFYRKRGDTVPHQVRYNLPIEILYTVSRSSWSACCSTSPRGTRTGSTTLSAHPDVVVDVTGFQWSWEFQYPQYPVKNSANGVTEVGYMWNGKLGSSQQRERAAAAGDPRP